jgi:DNA-binding CsgD family transcriptional regulator
MNNRVSTSVEHVLSPSEMKVARFVAWGYVKKEIAECLHRSELTVQTQLKSIYRKLEIHKETDLTRWVIFYEYGIADNPFKKIVTILFLVLSISSIVYESSSMMRVLRAAPMRNVAMAAKPVRSRRSIKWFDLPQLATA